MMDTKCTEMIIIFLLNSSTRAENTHFLKICTRPCFWALVEGGKHRVCLLCNSKFWIQNSYLSINSCLDIIRQCLQLNAEYVFKSVNTFQGIREDKSNIFFFLSGIKIKIFRQSSDNVTPYSDSTETNSFLKWTSVMTGWMPVHFRASEM